MHGPGWITSFLDGLVGLVVGTVLSSLLQGRQARRAAERALEHQREESIEARLKELELWKAEQTGERKRRTGP